MSGASVRGCGRTCASRLMGSLAGTITMRAEGSW